MSKKSELIKQLAERQKMFEEYLSALKKGAPQKKKAPPAGR